MYDDPVSIWFDNYEDEEDKPVTKKKKLSDKEVAKIAKRVAAEMEIANEYMPIGLIIDEPDKRGYIHVPSTIEEMEREWEQMEIDRNPCIITVLQ